MPSPLGFFADVIRTGTVVGVDWTFSPDEVTQAFGIDPAINQHGQHLWHDYGLVEYFWEQVNGRWRGTHFSVQLHRLNNQRGYEIPKVIAEHGTPPPRVAFDSRRRTRYAAWSPYPHPTTTSPPTGSRTRPHSSSSSPTTPTP